ncbi:unnamed protein product [Echinostoma caproni]|uniref:Uncharacterized protein n=1 Tax=Echinostoma caproni TaxID=27848 RepID=A0A183ALR0_9TREM|nr:unnamed protein product [Echinostoma caproni]
MLNELIDRGHVVKSDTYPERYRLTVIDVSDSSDTCSLPQSTVEHSHKDSPPPNAPQLNCDSVDIRSEAVHSVDVADYPLKFLYADENCQATRFRASAHTKQFTSDEDDSELHGLRILCCYEDLITSGLCYRLDWSGSSADSTFSTVAYLLDPDAPSCCTGDLNQADITPSPPAIVSSSPPPPLQSYSDEPLNKRPRSPSLSANPIPTMTLYRTKSEGSTLPSDTKYQKQMITKLVENRPAPQMISPENRPVQATYFNRIAVGSSSSDVVIVPGGTYELILICDVREHFG